MEGLVISNNSSSNIEMVRTKFLARSKAQRGKQLASMASQKEKPQEDRPESPVSPHRPHTPDYTPTIIPSSDNEDERMPSVPTSRKRTLYAIESELGNTATLRPVSATGEYIEGSESFKVLKLGEWELWSCAFTYLGRSIQLSKFAELGFEKWASREWGVAAKFVSLELSDKDCVVTFKIRTVDVGDWNSPVGVKFISAGHHE